MNLPFSNASIYVKAPKKFGPKPKERLEYNINKKGKKRSKRPKAIDTSLALVGKLFFFFFLFGKTHAR